MIHKTQLGVAQAVVALVAFGAPADAQSTRRVSTDVSGNEGNLDSYNPDTSPGGRYVAFESDADNLVAFDGNGVRDVFVRDLLTGAVERVSTDSAGGEGNGPSRNANVSREGRFVSFQSEASNLVPGDTNGVSDVFVKDRASGLTLRVSVDSVGAEADGPSTDASMDHSGDFIAFASGATNLTAPPATTFQVYLKHVPSGSLRMVSVTATLTPGNAPSGRPSVAPDASGVAFESDADNLVPDFNGLRDVYVNEFASFGAVLASVSASFGQANRPCLRPSLGKGSQVVAFETQADSLIAGDTNGVHDVYVRDLFSANCERVSLSASGAEADGACGHAAIAQGGRWVAFDSEATNLVSGDTNGTRDCFLKYRPSGFISRVSLSDTGAQANQGAFRPALNEDVSLVAFDSTAFNLVAADTNSVSDVFVRRWCPASWNNYGVGDPGTLGVPGLTLLEEPIIGTSPKLDIGNSAGTPTITLLFIGFAETSIPSAWGGDLLVVPSISPVVVPLMVDGLQLPVPIPYNPEFCGAKLFMQSLVVDPGSVGGVAFSEGLRLVFGL